MFPRPKRVLLTATLLSLTLAVGASGCDGPDLQAYCEEVSSCENLNDKDTEACVVLQEALESINSDLGCSDEHTAYYDCLLEKGKCSTQDIGGGCQTNEDCPVGECTTDMTCQSKRFGLEDDDDCKAEREAYNNCSFE
jgi:hypothetical protein